MRKESRDSLEAQPDQVVLEKMDVDDTELREILDEILGSKTGVKSLFFKRNKISDTGAGFIADAVAKLPELSEIDLQFNNIGAKGVEALFTARAVFRPALDIALHGNQIKDAREIEQIKKAVEQKSGMKNR